MIEEELKKVEGIDKYGVNVPDWAEDIKVKFVEEVMGDKLETAKEWISEMYYELEALKEKLNVRGWLFSREMKSFLDDPKRHLVKKLFLYFHDLIRGSMSVDEFITKGRQAINSSLGSNLRSVYQTWGLAAILLNLADKGFRLSYPEHGFLNFDRSGKQKSGIMPPNVIVEDIFGRAFSFFLEAPRPISWEDGGDLERVWKLYSTLRPDMLIYKGFYMNIVDLDNGDIPIKRPNVIVEFKELEDWWKRWRYLKEYRPLNGNEWRARWIKGLYEGLGEVLGVKPQEVPKFTEVKERRIKEYKIVELYMKIYKPDKASIVSKVPVDEEVKKDLSDVIVIDNVMFNDKKLGLLVENLLENDNVNPFQTNIKDLAYMFALEN
ncbi:MAG: hypothetical protein JZD40_05795, partial [Sulfolobus sp.]|nr:hypothetical protein [Sulfolobus sp.]